VRTEVGKAACRTQKKTNSATPTFFSRCTAQEGREGGPTSESHIRNAATQQDTLFSYRSFLSSINKQQQSTDLFELLCNAQQFSRRHCYTSDLWQRPSSSLKLVFLAHLIQRL
jgi:hypothetical protein